MDRSQIIPRRHSYLIVVCVVFLALFLLAAGCTGKDATSSAKTSQAVETTEKTPQAGGPSTAAKGDGVQDGDLVEINYTGTLANGSVFDKSEDHGPFQFVVGTGSAITGFDNAIKGMKLNEKKKFTLTPAEAYGEYNASLIKTMPIDFVPKGENVTVGDVITLFNGEAYFQAKILQMNATNITFDLNSPLAGQTLTFDVTLVNLTPASEVQKMMEEFAAQQQIQIPVEAVNTSAGTPAEKAASSEKPGSSEKKGNTTA
jgi:FKBP-type peptidyl-prolyl cis-trans isomerase 2